jgi:hypothetical protein
MILRGGIEGNQIVCGVLSWCNRYFNQAFIKGVTAVKLGKKENIKKPPVVWFRRWK